MGKKDGGQRTKGNTKPSSSARSAELLQSQPFFTSADGSEFSGSSDFGSAVAPIFGLTSLNPEEEALIPSQMKMSIRKMTKKDATTRLKAVQEFTEMCEAMIDDQNQAGAGAANEEVTKMAVKAVLPFWPRIYQRLSIDLDRRVRESGQKAHLVLIGIVGRDLAPHLKALAPAWYLSRADPHAPAAVLADKSFSVTFPTQEKKRNAILFCQAEILGHIQDNLTNQNAMSLSDAKTTSSEDMDSKYFRVLSSSLTSYTTFLNEICKIEGKNDDDLFKEYLVKNSEHHLAILSHAHFWKLANHKNSSVRTAWYSVANVVCQKMLNVSKDDSATEILVPKLESKLSTLVLGKLDESDASVASIIWEASLHLTQNSKRWSESVSVEKQVLLKVLSVMENACHKGQVNAHHIYPNVLPLLSQLIPKLMSTWKEEEVEDKLSTLYSKLLCAIRNGLDHFLSLAPKSCGQQLLRKGGSSNAAKLAVETYFDCLLYGITNNYKKKIAEIIQTRILEWISDILTQPEMSDKQVESDILFQSLANFIWSMQKRLELGGTDTDGVAEFYANILSKISELTMTVFEQNKFEMTAHFLTILITNPSKLGGEEKKSKKGGLKFQDEIEQGVQKIYLTNCFNVQIKENLSSSESGSHVTFASLPLSLQSLLVQVASLSTEKILSAAVDKTAKQHVVFLTQIFDCFAADSDTENNFYSKLLQNSSGTTDGAVDLLQAVAHSKLLNDAGENTSKNGHLVQFCLVIARSVSSASKSKLYESLFDPKAEEDKKVTDWLLASLLQAEDHGSLVKRSVLSGSSFAEKIRHISNSLLNEKEVIGTGAWTLLAIALKNSNFMSDEICNVIMSNFADSLREQRDAAQFLRLVQFLNDVFLYLEEWPSMSSELLSTTGGQALIFELLKLSCSKREACSVDFTSLWIQGFQSLDVKLGKDFLAQTCAHVKSKVEEATSEVSQDLVFQSFSLLNLLRQEELEMNWQTAWLNLMPDLVIDGVTVDGEAENLFLFSVEEDVHLAVFKLKSDKKVSTFNNFKKRKQICEFFLKTGSLLLENTNNVDLNPNLLDFLAQSVTYFCVEMNSEAANRKISENLVKEHLSTEAKQNLKDILFKNSWAFGRNWSLALFRVMTWLSTDPGCKNQIKIEDLVSLTTVWSEPEVQTLQVLMKFAEQRELRGLVQTEIGCLLSLQPGQEEEKYRMTVSLTLIVSVFRLLNLENEIELKESLKSVLDLVSFWRQTKEEEFLYATNVEDRSFDDVVFVVSISTFLQLALDVLSVNAAESSIKLEPVHWDLILCSLSSWVQSVDESADILKSVAGSNPTSDKIKEVTMFTVAVVQLASVVAQVLDRVAKLENRTDVENQLLEEWKEFFSDAIFAVLINLFVELANCNSGKGSKFSQGCQSLLVSLGESLRLMPAEQFQGHKLPAKYVADDLDSLETTTFPENLVFILNHLVPMLSCDRGSYYERRSISTTAYKLLSHVMDKVVECQESNHEKEGSMQIAAAYKARAKVVDKEVEKDDNEGEEDDEDIEEMCELPRRITDQLNMSEPVLQALFAMSDLSFGEPLPTIFPTDSQPYTYAMSLLLTWKLILRLISLSSSELRPKFSEFLRRRGHMDTMMETIFHLMTLPKDLASGSPIKCKRSFGADPPLPVVIASEEIGEELKELAASVYYGLLRDLPALIRSWWNSSDKRTANFVEKFTTNEASPVLWSEEAQRINSSKSYDNMTTKVRSSVREVVATYTLDEGSMELVIKVPLNFPLGPVAVESGKKIGVTNSQWRTWMLQLITFLQHQNGSIVDGLAVWKRNLDKRFDGVEECYICFYILHGSSHQLPKLACRTCKKKFHSACLYKWFSTSNNSTCPLCRNLF